jgi:phosphoenolpyruvate synthase/pyruvate phosphate dikinase
MISLMNGIIKLGDSFLASEVGGKAAALARLRGAGFKIADGFSITSPDISVEEILAAFDLLGSEYVAVRSSAVAEDGQSDAWAGQFETYLNVRRQDLPNKVAACFKSGESARAKAYASQKGLNESRVSVLIQAMIQGRVSGIAFSANPISQSHDELVIEAALGLNEAIVSGEVTPDTFILAKSDGRVISASIAHQLKKLALSGGASKWLEVDNSQPKLTEDEILQVKDEVIKLEKYFGFPVDVEWTFAGDSLFILQCRPITTLK